MGTIHANMKGAKRSLLAGEKTPTDEATHTRHSGPANLSIFNCNKADIDAHQEEKCPKEEKWEDMSLLRDEKLPSE